MTMDKKQMNLFKAETTWFHVFVSMIENGDVAKMGPYAVTVYLVVKAYTNWKTGKAFPSIETIAEKSGISRRQVINSLATLAENGYIDKTKVGRKNSYTLREKITLKDQEGRPAAFATWDYLPSTVEARAQDSSGGLCLPVSMTGRFSPVKTSTCQSRSTRATGI